MKRRLTILGCGSSGGVPRIGSMWGKCDPENPKNRRRRCSVLVEQFAEQGQATRILVDTSPDMREQLLATRTASLDAVLFTHDHADHTHGIDDLRMVAYAMKRRIECYFDAETKKSIVSRFGYCFKGKERGGYPAILNTNIISSDDQFSIQGSGGAIDVSVVRQHHGDLPSLGFRFANLAYSPDISDLDEDVVERLQGLDVWIVDALRHQPHVSHFHVKKALEWIARLKPTRAVLTHMTGELDYEALKRDLPDGVEPAYDGMEIAF
ncbi:MAG: MBL fold metallo-hydrolase [Alphaproteobacteria bacterium]|nr:MBL fold metallo-hydrolase [Alphaproteobacteria bacterium]